MPKKPELIRFTGEQQQRFLMNCAKQAIGMYGSQFEAKLDNIYLLIGIRGFDAIKNLDSACETEFGKSVKDMLSDFASSIGIVVAYKNGLDNKTIDKNDVTSYRFIKWRESISFCYRYVFFVDRIIIELCKGTVAQGLTIPSQYWSYVTAKEIVMPEKQEEDEGE